MGSESLLWSITSPEQQQSWLFGTMHIRDERAHQLNENLYPLILKADAFVGEMDMSPPDKEVENMMYDTRGFVKEGPFDKLRHQIVKSFRIDLIHYNHLHPLMIMSAISASVLEAEHLISLDEHLWNYAKENQKMMLGLESYEEQFQLLHSLETGPLYKQLQAIGRNPSKVRHHTTRGLNFYMTGNIHALYILSKTSMHDLRKKIIYERNIRMASRIMQLDPSVQYFITVGAGHLSGKTGIISILKHSGWTVKPIYI